MEILQLLWSHCCPLVNTPQLNCQLNYSAISSQPPLQSSTEFIAPAVLVITSLHGPHRKHCSSIVALVSIATGTYLPSCCPETALVYSPVSQLLHSNGCTRYSIVTTVCYFRSSSCTLLTCIVEYMCSCLGSTSTPEVECFILQAGRRCTK
jgi:hypothetical protein